MLEASIRLVKICSSQTYFCMYSLESLISELCRTGAGDTELRLTVERGDHIVPNIREAFPAKTSQELDQVNLFGNKFSDFLLDA